MRHALRLLCLILFFGLIILTAQAGSEQRCVDLGANCVCSEPLDVVQSLPGGTHINPNDTTELECPGETNDGRAVRVKNTGSTPAERLMPSGNSVDYVWGIHGAGINFLEGAGDAITPNTRRTCQRIYYRFSSVAAGDAENYSLTTAGDTCLPEDLGFPDCCERNKGMSMSSDSLANYSVNADGEFFHANWVVRAAAGGIARDKRLESTGPGIGLEDCMNSWCRLEMCVAGNLWTGQGIYPDARITQLSTGDTRTFYDDEGPLNNVTPVTSFDRAWIGNMFRQVNVNIPETETDPTINQSPDHACRGIRFVSHAMQAQWDSDEGQWIGPAEEIEGLNPNQDLEPPARPVIVE